MKSNVTVNLRWAKLTRSSYDWGRKSRPEPL